MRILDNLITALVKKEIRNKFNYLTKDYINTIIEQVITKEVNKLLDDKQIQNKVNNKLDKKLDINELIKHTEFRSISTLREYVTKTVNEQFKLETGSYFYTALVEFLNKK